jgi:hypothetical protein
MRRFRDLLNAKLGSKCVDSEGIDRSPSSPFLSGDAYRSLCPVSFELQSGTGCKYLSSETCQLISAERFHELLSHGSCVFVKSDCVDNFHNQILPTLKVSIVLVTGNSDYPISHQKNLGALLDSSRIIHWYAMNADFQHKKLSAIPLGLENQRWAKKRPSIEAILNIYEASCSVASATLKREKQFALVTFTEQHHPDRKRLLNHLRGAKWTSRVRTTNLAKYFEEVSNSTYVFCPRGNGYDTHRFWESLYLGSTPVVEKSPIGMVSMYDLVGALVVNNWTDVSESFLKTVASGSNSTRSLPDINIEHIESAVDPLWLPFWEKKILAHKRKNV